MSSSDEQYATLLQKLKLQTDQRLRLENELQQLTRKFDNFQDVQQNIQLVVSHRHQSELDSLQAKYNQLEQALEFQKQRQQQAGEQSDLEMQLQEFQQQILSLQTQESLLKQDLITEKSKSQTNLELYFSTQAKLSRFQEEYTSQQLGEQHLVQLILLQSQIDQHSLAMLSPETMTPKEYELKTEIDTIGTTYPTATMLLKELSLLKIHQQTDAQELLTLRSQLQDLTDQVGKVNGSITTSRTDAALLTELQDNKTHLENEIQDRQKFICELQNNETKYIDEIDKLKQIITDQQSEFQTIIKQNNELYTTTQSTQKKLTENVMNTTASLEQDLANMSLMAPSEGMNTNSNSGVTTQQLEQYTAQIKQLQTTIATLEHQNEELLDEITNSQQFLEQMKGQHEELESTLNETIEHKKSITTHANQQIKLVLEAVTTARQERDEYRQQVTDKESILTQLQIKYQQDLSEQSSKQIGVYITQLQTIQQELTDFKQELLNIREYISSLNQTNANNDNSDGKTSILSIIKNYVSEQNTTLTFLKKRYDDEVKLRKNIFNQLQELKGNIRVFARIRPLSQNEKKEQGSDLSIVQKIKDDELRVLQEKDGKKNTHSFDYEQVFGPDSTQEQVFAEVKDLVSSCLDGFNVCIFAYGQTGSGKTYTMQGYGGERGVNPRSLEMLFNHINSTSDECEWNIQLTVVEIYNEKIQDLLRPVGSPEQGLKIQQNKDGSNYIAGCNIVAVTSAEEVQSWLTKGEKNRHVSKTDMNDASSRSHLVLTVYTQCVNKLTKVKSSGRLNLIDLAGSERISRSNVSGDGLKEAQAINSSLSNLGNVIAARANKNAHVPYRNSQLTYLLQDSLDKNSKTLMIVQLSPSSESCGETLCSLRFASRVKEVELGKASAAKQATD